jgi:hypothetical protein
MYDVRHDLALPLSELMVDDSLTLGAFVRRSC